MYKIIHCSAKYQTGKSTIRLELLYHCRTLPKFHKHFKLWRNQIWNKIFLEEQCSFFSMCLWDNYKNAGKWQNLVELFNSSSEKLNPQWCGATQVLRRRACWKTRTLIWCTSQCAIQYCANMVIYAQYMNHTIYAPCIVIWCMLNIFRTMQYHTQALKLVPYLGG